jgi:hypothetical protein
MSNKNLEEVERAFQFLSTLRESGPVHSTLRPVLEKLRFQMEAEELQQRSTAVGVTVIGMSENGNGLTPKNNDTIVTAVHKAMCNEGFICIVEKPSSVPGFAAPVRGIAENYMISHHPITVLILCLCIHYLFLLIPCYSVTSLSHISPHTELPPHQLPEGWNSNPNTYSLMYKHRQRPGKQFMLTVSDQQFLLLTFVVISIYSDNMISS